MKSRDEIPILNEKSIMPNYGVNTAKLNITAQNPPKIYTAHFLQVVYVRGKGVHLVAILFFWNKRNEISVPEKKKQKREHSLLYLKTVQYGHQ